MTAMRHSNTKSSFEKYRVYHRLHDVARNEAAEQRHRGTEHACNIVSRQFIVSTSDRVGSVLPQHQSLCTNDIYRPKLTALRTGTLRFWYTHRQSQHIHRAQPAQSMSHSEHRWLEHKAPSCYDATNKSQLAKPPLQRITTNIAFQCVPSLATSLAFLVSVRLM